MALTTTKLKTTFILILRVEDTAYRLLFSFRPLSLLVAAHPSLSQLAGATPLRRSRSNYCGYHGTEQEDGTSITPEGASACCPPEMVVIVRESEKHETLTSPRAGLPRQRSSLYAVLLILPCLSLSNISRKRAPTQ